MSFQPGLELETAGKARAVACLDAAIAAFRVPRKVLADDLQMSEGQFSKLAAARQGDFLAFVYDLPAPLRADFFHRLAESEDRDPESVAAEQLLIAAARFLRIARCPSRVLAQAVAAWTKEAS